MLNQYEVFRFQVTVHAIEIFDHDLENLNLKISLGHSKMLDAGRVFSLRGNRRTQLNEGRMFMARLDSRISFKDAPVYIFLSDNNSSIVGAAGFQLAPLVVDSYTNNENSKTHNAKLRLSDRYENTIGSIEVIFNVRHFVSDLNAMKDTIIEEKPIFASVVDSQLETEPQIDDSHFRKHAETNPISNTRTKTRITLPDLLRITRRYQVQTDELAKELDMTSDIVGYAESIERKKKMEKLQHLRRKILKLESKIDMMSESSVQFTNNSNETAHFGLLDTLDQVQQLLQSYKPQHHRHFRSHKSKPRQDTLDMPAQIKKPPPAFIPKLELHSVSQSAQGAQSSRVTERIPRCFQVVEKKMNEEPVQIREKKRVKQVSARLFNDKRDKDVKMKIREAKPAVERPKTTKSKDKVLKTIVLSAPEQTAEGTLNITESKNTTTSEIKTISVDTPTDLTLTLNENTDTITRPSTIEISVPDSIIQIDEKSNLKTEDTPIDMSIVDDFATETFESKNGSTLATSTSPKDMSIVDDFATETYESKQESILEDSIKEHNTSALSDVEDALETTIPLASDIIKSSSDDSNSSISVGGTSDEEPTIENIDPVIKPDDGSFISADFVETSSGGDGETSESKDYRSSVDKGNIDDSESVFSTTKSSSSINFQLSQSDPKISDFLGTKEETEDPSAILSLLNTDKIDVTKSGSVQSSNLDINSILSFM